MSGLNQFLKGIRKYWEGPSPGFFLKQIKGLIHVGASTGQERDLYAANDLAVAWVEPLPDSFKQLQEAISHHPKQQCFNYLVTDQDDKEYTFYVSSNEGHSSSILPLSAHKEIWPDVHYVQNLTLKGITLPSLVRKEGLELSLYEALVLDTQGSELLILTGAADLLPNFKFIMCEVADFEAYAGCCQVSQVDAYLSQAGFRPVIKNPFVKSKLGNYYDIIYQRK
jgi:FkbM family methyltransferase